MEKHLFDDRNGQLMLNALDWIWEHMVDADSEDYGVMAMCRDYMGMTDSELEELRTWYWCLGEDGEEV